MWDDPAIGIDWPLPLGAAVHDGRDAPERLAAECVSGVGLCHHKEQRAAFGQPACVSEHEFAVRGTDPGVNDQRRAISHDDADVGHKRYSVVADDEHTAVNLDRLAEQPRVGEGARRVTAVCRGPFGIRRVVAVSHGVSAAARVASATRSVCGVVAVVLAG